MAEIKPFCALRFSELAGSPADFCCPPYDVISPEDQRRFYEKSPYNVIRLELNREDDCYEDSVQTLRQWMNDGILRTDSEEAIYIYEQEFSLPGHGKKTLRTFISRLRLCEFNENIVMPHEETLNKAKDDRMKLLRATGCNFSQIYLLYHDDSGAVEWVFQAECSRKPDIEFVFEDNIVQRLWIMTDKARIAAVCKAFARLQVFIADGHHRYETALQNCRELIQSGKIGAEDDNAAHFCMAAFADTEDDGLVVLPTHRLVRGLPNFDLTDIRVKLRENFAVLEDRPLDLLQHDLYENREEACFGLYTGGERYDLLVLKDKEAPGRYMPSREKAYTSLDVAVLHGVILEPLFGIDKASMAKQANLVYTRSEDEAIARVKSGEFQCAFFLNPTRVEQVIEIASMHLKMPQKSTYFYPKPITGLVMNKLENI